MEPNTTQHKTEPKSKARVPKIIEAYAHVYRPAPPSAVSPAYQHGRYAFTYSLVLAANGCAQYSLNAKTEDDATYFEMILGRVRTEHGLSYLATASGLETRRLEILNIRGQLWGWIQKTAN